MPVQEVDRGWACGTSRHWVKEGGKRGNREGKGSEMHEQQHTLLFLTSMLFMLTPVIKGDLTGISLFQAIKSSNIALQMCSLCSLCDVCLSSSSPALWNQAAFQVWKARPGLCLKGSLQSLFLSGDSPLIFDLSISKARCPASGYTLAVAYCRQLEPRDADHRGVQQTFSAMEEQGTSLQYLSNANKFCTRKKCQDISP